MMRKISNVRAHAGKLGLGVGLSLLLSGCSGADDFGDILDNFKPGHGHGHGHAGSHSGPPPSGSCGFVDWDDVYEAIELDVLTQDAEDRPFLRYVTLANEQDNACDNLLDPIFSISEVLGLTSRGAGAPEPTPIAGTPITYRLDLRDYDWDASSGSLTVGAITFDDVWEAVAEASPFAVEFQGDNAENVVLQTETLKPVLFADAFVAVTARGPIFAALGGSGTGSSIQTVLNDFDADVRLAVAAGDVLVPAENFARDIPRLDPALSGLDDGFAVDRDDWATLYLETLCILSVGNENQPTEEVCASATP